MSRWCVIAPRDSFTSSLRFSAAIAEVRRPAAGKGGCGELRGGVPDDEHAVPVAMPSSRASATTSPGAGGR